MVRAWVLTSPSKSIKAVQRGAMTYSSAALKSGTKPTSLSGDPSCLAQLYFGSLMKAVAPIRQRQRSDSWIK